MYMSTAFDISTQVHKRAISCSDLYQLVISHTTSMYSNSSDEDVWLDVSDTVSTCVLWRVTHLLWRQMTSWQLMKWQPLKWRQLRLVC